MKWGILATGSIAAKFAATVRRMRDEDRLAACCSRSLERAEQFAREHAIPKAYGSYEELMEDRDVDAVYVATPNSLHYDNCRMCLEAGKHVLCEKPFTTNAQEANELFLMAEKKGLFIMEAFWIRHLPALKKMRELIRWGVIGDVGFARSEFGFVAAGARKDRKFDASLGGGALLDIGIYNLGFIHMVMEDQAPVHFTSSYHLNEYGTDDFSSITLEYPGRRGACVTTSIGLQLSREAVVYGTKGSIYLPDYQMAEQLVVRIPAEGERIEEFPFDVNGFEYQIREVNRCVRLGMSVSDVLKKEDTLTVLRLMDQIRESWGMKFSWEQERKQ